MKILRLDLLAFGPFTKRSLDFSKGTHGLHLVYGPNEAGKSSSLRAIRQLLFGIPTQTGDNFLHPHPKLRIGAQLLGNDDRAIEVVRRKGRDKTLRGGDDVEVLLPQMIEQMLGHIDEDTFCSQFGIDHQQLTAGGRQIAEGKGEAGSTLFAAASGITGLNAVLEKLNSDAKVLFLPTGSKPEINQSITALTAAKKRIKEALLLSEDWTRHHEALQAAFHRKLEIDRELEQVTSERLRLDRIRRALPIVPQYVQLKQEAIQLADAPQLADDFGESRRRAMADLSIAGAQQEAAKQTIERLQTTIDSLVLPETILEYAERIETIVKESGGYDKGIKDLPGLHGRHQEIEHKILHAVQDLGERAEVTQMHISPDVKIQISELGALRQSLLSQHETAIARAREIERNLTGVHQTLAKLPAACHDGSALQRTIRDVEKQGAIEDQLAGATLRLRQMEEQGKIDLLRLEHWSGTLDRLERLAVPTRESIDRYDVELRDRAAAVDRASEVVDSIEGELREKETQLDRLGREQDIPSEADLQTARQRRALGWRLVRAALQGKNVGSEQEKTLLEHFTSAPNLTEAFEQSIEAADIIADRLRREAEAVSQKATLTAEQTRLSERIELAQQSLADATAMAGEKQQQWQAIWNAIDVAGQTPLEMREWIDRQQALVDASRAIREQRDDVARLEQLIDDQKTRLSGAISQLGEDGLSVGQSLAMQLEHCRELSNQFTETEQQRKQAMCEQARLQSDQTVAQQKVDDASRAIEDWNTKWSETIAPLGLLNDASVAQANAILQAVADITTMTSQSAELSQRIEGIAANCQSFQAKVHAVCEHVADDLVDQVEESVGQAVFECRDRLTAARKAKTKLDGYQKQQAEQREHFDTATTKRNEAEAKLKALCHEAGCQSPDELQEAVNRSDRRSTNSEKLQSLDDQLLGLSAGKSVDEFIAEIQQVDADRLPSTTEHLEQRLGELNDEKSEVDSTIGSEQAQLAAIDSSAEAARANEDAEQLRASIAADAQTYARLRLSSVVLRGAIERYRERHQGPLLRRASELFCELTLGNFDELRADYDSKGNATLLGVRQGSGATVGTGQMSDGTCDQLYLALRLASLEQHFRSNPTVPFIVDDVLNRFDDDRAIAALKALARLSEKTQVIFFTHHEHLVKLAEENLDNDVLFTHTLESDPQPDADR